MPRVAFVCVIALLAAPCLGRADDKAKPKHHPHLHAALHELRLARTELEKSKAEYAGKREKALGAVDAAISSIKQLLEIKGDYKGINRDKSHYAKHKHHPHLHAALADLRHARTELHESKHNFGGDKKQALKDIDYAIVQIKELIDAMN